MNKKKIEKIITHNIESNGDFNKIKDSIVFSKKENKRVSVKDFIFNYRTLRLVCPLLAMIIILPFLPMMFSKNSNASNGSMNCSNQISENTPFIPEANSSSCSSVATSFLVATVGVNGIIVIENEEKLFYTDESYGYSNELNKDREFIYEGFYKLDKVNNYDELLEGMICIAEIVVDVGEYSYYEVGDIYSIEVVI